ncbi:MAG: hypothetical protein DRG78_01995 [Epsilonproteobacteria bacterium]|nr:MAG: hypothetical protein DRG78_01995 [Campylobacterota bacterium]
MIKILFYGRYFFYIAIALIFINWLQKFIAFDDFIFWIIQQSQDNNFYFLFALFLSSILETIFILSFYFPGSIVLATVILSLSSELDIYNLLIPIIIIWCGINVGIFLNYILGKYFSDFVNKLGHRNIINSTKQLLNRYGSITGFFLSIHPNYIGTLYLVAGITSISIKKMMPLTIFGTITSIIIWSTIFINTSTLIKQSNINHTYMLSIVCVLLGLLWGFYKLKKEKKF